MSKSSPMSSSVVIDAGIGVFTVLDSALTPNIETLWQGWLLSGVRICVPQLWLNEVTSAIHKVFMQKLVSETKAAAALEAALFLPVEPVGEDIALCGEAFQWATRLGQFSAYDSFYLALAARLGAETGAAELWTADERLANRSRQIGAGWVRWAGENIVSEGQP